MRAGKMDRTIRIDAFDAGAVNDFGTPTPGFTPLATLRAQIIQASTQELLEAQGVTDDTVIIFRTRWIDGVTNAGRIHYDGGYFNIRGTKEIGRRKGMDLRCVKAMTE
ncbi:phage head closure protein [Pararhizobium sp. YC-54]|uniref:phage head closure protein n=1 Tax=Pararhizobium sp. YC-54 TaxID=2986920 RepID=UPI0021F6E229|nr:phage head closure protein [Pararhizobium sp. YC-54]MCV9997680.1 phage head closure protein [Pararhizobium sp. YC-54]